ncbi:MAG: hypothetical protein A2632_00370 [Candidatus Pacebacteria bacterium RIFCSPHIGHO2_01_FULL_46_16]|nr:MAG: hypothetical protein A2632_00370 [Candidatus Pacebacteria bacterium RIFCSPHIGHO2_01_FULL_46_16]OGJ21090.1 MAG: hypothetical protein A3J60_03730 [Candidatus Pacebacteria bacterium RIFCSPHIGHO2_02_FULL_46_9]OGJ38746.1 MAG: hypothetical protein A3A82_03405 [Candidatus Pacebacteria bacterium RIFCSPLOWO2_01_FULL_47_12]
MNEFSFWIIPENELYQELENVIVKYSAEYASPIFIPHLTLHNPIVSTDEQILVAVREAARKIHPFEIQVGAVECSTTYFQSVFVRMKTSAALLTAHMVLKDALGVTEEFVFMPHVSLVYGDFDMTVRDKMAREITITGKSFQAEKITVVRADSRDPKDWDVVGSVSL